MSDFSWSFGCRKSPEQELFSKSSNVHPSNLAQHDSPHFFKMKTEAMTGKGKGDEDKEKHIFKANPLGDELFQVKLKLYSMAWD